MKCPTHEAVAEAALHVVAERRVLIAVLVAFGLRTAPGEPVATRLVADAAQVIRHDTRIERLTLPKGFDLPMRDHRQIGSKVPRAIGAPAERELLNDIAA